MSAISDRLATRYYEGRRTSFLTPAFLFTDEDQWMIDAGIFKLSNKIATTIPCPFGCGHPEAVETQLLADGTAQHFVCCTHGNDPRCKLLAPRDYQLYAFDPVAALPHLQTIRSMNEKAAIDESIKTVLIREPDGTLDDTKRFMRELSILVLTNHGKRFNLHTLLQSVLWIFGKHQPTDPFYNECVIAEKLRVGGRKPKLASSMYQYARQGIVSNTTILKQLAKEQAALKIEMRQEELAELAKIDPDSIT